MQFVTTESTLLINFSSASSSSFRFGGHLFLYNFTDDKTRRPCTICKPNHDDCSLSPEVNSVPLSKWIA